MGYTGVNDCDFLYNKMKFWIMLAACIGIGVWAMKSCGDGKGSMLSSISSPGDALAGAVPGVKSDDQDAAPGEKPKEKIDPYVTLTYLFKNRPAPDFSSAGRVSVNGEPGIDIYVDKVSNVVVVKGPSSSAASVILSMQELDRTPAEAFVDATLIFVRGDRVRDFELGVSYGPSGAFSGEINPGGFGVVLPAGRVALSLDWLAENGTLEIIDKPRIRIASGEVSEVVTVEEVPVPVSVYDNGLSRSSIEFKRVGLTFKVEPFFLAADRCRLKISAENGLVGEARNIGGIEIPSINNQRIATVATLGSDDGILVGGLETVRRSTRFGLLGERSSAEAGRLYLCVVLRSGVPKAIDVAKLPPEGFLDVPGVPSARRVRRSFWDVITGRRSSDLDDGVLPPRSWESDERDFIRSKASK